MAPSLPAQRCLPGSLRILVKDSQEAPVFDVLVQLTSGENKLAPQLTGSEGVTDPQYSVFFGNWHRRYRFDFEVLF